MNLKRIGQELSHPTRSLAGWLITKFLKSQNRMLEENAVKLCGIQPSDTVLELGHGPGLGLQSAAQLLTRPTGKLIGVDYSQYMHQMAKDLLKEQLASGKVVLYQCDVAAMPLADSSVDRVFHSNCFYFWPDLRKGASEIYRVMKPGGLMVTTLRLNKLMQVSSMQVFPMEIWGPEPYMQALRESGFSDVRMENLKDRNINFEAIYAIASK